MTATTKPSDIDWRAAGEHVAHIRAVTEALQTEPRIARRLAATLAALEDALGVGVEHPRQRPAAISKYRRGRADGASAADSLLSTVAYDQIIADPPRHTCGSACCPPIHFTHVLAPPFGAPYDPIAPLNLFALAYRDSGLPRVRAVHPAHLAPATLAPLRQQKWAVWHD